MTGPTTSDRSIPLAVALFLLTCLSALYVGTSHAELAREGILGLAHGASFAAPMMAILLAHEMGHYITARRYGVDVSPPFFIPMPLLFLGTLGAVIHMRGRIERRNQLFDIGAAGPLAGLGVALPVFFWGVHQSQFVALSATNAGMLLGDSLVSAAIIYLAKGPTPPGTDLVLHPTALAGWAGLLVTMINLVPSGQLDGGHIAYALFGPKQVRYSRRFRQALLPLSLTIGALAYVREGQPEALWAGIHWFMWWLMLSVMASLAPGEHPATSESALSPTRRVVAWATLALFALLFMPSWIRPR